MKKLIYPALLTFLIALLIGIIFIRFQDALSIEKVQENSVLEVSQETGEQTLTNTCGPESLALICKTFGIETSVKELVRLAKTDKTGTTMYNLAQAAKAKGLTPKGVKPDLKQLKRINLPAITVINNDHYVIITKLEKGKVYINDPNKGIITLTQGEFSEIWNRSTLVFNK